MLEKAKLDCEILRAYFKTQHGISVMARIRYDHGVDLANISTPSTFVKVEPRSSSFLCAESLDEISGRARMGVLAVAWAKLYLCDRARWILDGRSRFARRWIRKHAPELGIEDACCEFWAVLNDFSRLRRTAHRVPHVSETFLKLLEKMAA